MATQTVPRVTEEEYLERERASDWKHEFVDGEILAVSGGTLRHADLAMNFGSELKLRLRGSKCRVFTSDARVRTSATGSYVYPDLSVACGESPLYRGADDVLTNRKVVVEVLSPSTADFDRGRKFELYREIPTLEEYVLVHSESAHVGHFARQLDASWIFREYRGLEGAIVMPSLQCTIRMADAYAGIPLD